MARARKKRALSNVGGAVTVDGDDDDERRIVEAALAVDRSEAATRAHVHGFHSYPARLHPATARALVTELAPAGATVFDPFCGSGTVPVEARAAGRRAAGSDLNPLAVALAKLKTRAWSGEELQRLLEVTAEPVAFAEQRRTAKAGPTEKYGRVDRELFDPHVLLELDGLRAGIRKLDRADERRALLLVLSAVLTKVSRQSSDTSQKRASRRIASGFTIRHFHRKATDLVERLREYGKLVPEDVPAAAIGVADARRLRRTEARSVDLVVTSPPYPGIYDYVEHHAMRFRWLGMDEERLARSEMGARRHTDDAQSALERWQRDFATALRQMKRVLSPDGAIAVIIADSALAGRPIFADAVLRSLAPKTKLRVSALGSQRRAHFHTPTRRAFRGRPRREHLALLRSV